MGRPPVLASTLIALLLAAATSSSAWAQGAPAPTAPPPDPKAPAASAPGPGLSPAPSVPAGGPTAAPAAGAATTPGAPEEPETRPLVDLQNAPPPPTNVVYFQYGVAFTAEVVSGAGSICDNVAVPCILGSGGGIAVRAGWRGTGALYIGGAYELSKQDPNKLLRLAILQQVRAETRYYFIRGRETQPYGVGGLGVAGYGNEWGVDTFGPAGFLGVGVESQITRRTVVGVALAYRLIYFKQFMDSSGASRDGGISQLLGLDLVLEQREPVYTERVDAR